MAKTCLWCGGNFYDGFECRECGENENLIEEFNKERWEDDYPDFVDHNLVDFDDCDLLTLEELFEDIVHEPDHYSRWPIEPITFIMRNGFEFWRGSATKYIARAGYKIYDGKDAVESEITDLEKAKRFCDMRINQLRGETKL